MKHFLAGLCGLAIVALVTTSGEAGKAVKSQMVKGTIKSVDPGKDLLVVNQKVKKEIVDRELSILDTTKFVVVTGADKKEVTGKDGLQLLVGKEGSSVQIKCDKDVNVLEVKVTIKK
ncbi:MAG: hypothetical protein U0793_12335 [Gemmataceae bacterium]